MQIITIDKTSIFKRASALAIRLDIRPKASAISGVLRAINTKGYFGKNPVWDGAKSAEPSTEMLIEHLAIPFDQGQARKRLIDPYQPILDAVKAAIGHDCIDKVSRISNSYRTKYGSNAMESYSSAIRVGDAILIEFGRIRCLHSPYGEGFDEKNLVAQNSSGGRN